MNLKSIWSILTEADEPLDEYPMTAMMNVAAELDLPPDWVYVGGGGNSVRRRSDHSREIHAPVSVWLGSNQ